MTLGWDVTFKMTVLKAFYFVNILESQEVAKVE